MGQLLKFELKKILWRPFSLVVSIGCLLVIIFANIYAASETFLYAWGPDVYGSMEAIPEGELRRANDYYGLGGRYEGTLVFTGRRAIQLEKEYTAAIAGSLDNERLQALAAEYKAYRDDPAHYTNEVDSWAMEMRRWSLLDQGMSEAEVDAYEAANPMYVMDPKYMYSTRFQQLSQMGYLLENYVLQPDGTAASFEEAFPYVQAPAAYSYHAGPRTAAQFQGVLVGILCLLILLAGLAPIFSEEVSCHTEPMLLAARYGRSKLIRAKLLAGLLYALAGLVVLTAVNVLVCGAAYGGFEGYNVPIQFDPGTYSMPFTLCYWQYLLVIVGFQALGLLAMAGLTMLLSGVMRTAIPVVFAGGLFSIVVIMIAHQFTDGLRYLAQTLPPSLITPLSLLYDGRRPGWEFLPLPQWLWALIVGALVLAATMILLMKRYKRLSRT